MAREIGTDYESGSRFDWNEHLAAGESLLWSGKPKDGIRFNMLVAAISGIGFVSLIFSLFWIFATRNLTQGAGDGFNLFPLFGIPFAIIGLLATITPWIYDVYSRSRTHYAVTDQRILISRGVFPKMLSKVRLSAGLKITLRGNGPYSVVFRGPDAMTEDGPMRTYTGISYIEDGREVYELLSKIVYKLT